MADRVTWHELADKGGQWLAEAREWMQWNMKNGSEVTWGSNEELKPHLTVYQVENLASYVAAAAINEYVSEQERREQVKAGRRELVIRIPLPVLALPRRTLRSALRYWKPTRLTLIGNPRIHAWLWWNF